MADKNSSNWLVSPSDEVEEKWKAVAIQEKVSRIAACKQAIEDLQKGKIVELEAQILMFQRELEHLKSKTTINVGG